MGNLYTTATAVRLELVDDPGTTVLPDAAVAVYIVDRSRYIDDSLPNYPLFPDIAGTPSTPRTIERAARMLTAYDCLARLGLLILEEPVRPPVYFRTRVSMWEAVPVLAQPRSVASFCASAIRVRARTLE